MPDALWRKFTTPAIEEVLDAAHSIPGQMEPWQYALLYQMASQYDGKILEIGTFQGHSAWVMAIASPSARITSLTVSPSEAATAKKHLFGKSVDVMVMSSAQYLTIAHDKWDMIFVDGDHKHAARDLPWFNKLRVGGLMLFHDYSPEKCPPVYAAVQELTKRLQRDLDVEFIDSRGIGMAGVYRREGERI